MRVSSNHGIALKKKLHLMFSKAQIAAIDDYRLVVFITLYIPNLTSSSQGFILLRILFVSGAAFITGGLRRKSQALHPHRSQMNQTLLLAGFVSLQTIFVCFLKGTSEPLRYCYLFFSTLLLTIIPTSCKEVYTCQILSMNRCEDRS